MAGEEITLAIVGDVNFDREDPASLLAHCASHLREADIAFGNLEGVYSDRGTPITGKIEVGSAHLRCHPRNFQGFIAGGFDAVALANNHSMDFGGEALLQTVGLLDQAGIVHCGGGRNLAEAHAPCFLERKGTRFAFLSYTSVFIPGFSAGKDSPGCATVRVLTSYEPPANLVYQPGFPPIIHTYGDPVDVEMMVEDVRAAKAHADIVIVAWHWGISYGFGRVAEYQRTLGKAAIDAGADLIAGHHAHRLLGIETYKGKVITHSLGNFAFDRSPRPHFGKETMILKCYVRNKRIQKVTFLPALINEDRQPVVLDAKRGQPVIQLMADASEEFGTSLTVEGNEVVISAKSAPPEASWLYQATGLRARS